jgi:ribosomal protein S27AE
MKIYLSRAIMKKKQCFKCGETKPLSEFYAHPEMADGHLNKCKECTKKDTSQYYRDNIEHYREYERKRNQRPDRKRKKLRYMRKRRKNNSQKYKARCKVNNAIRDGRLERQPCEICGKKKVHAHHDDYSKPLDVRWLCEKHHNIEHGKLDYI